MAYLGWEPGMQLLSKTALFSINCAVRQVKTGGECFTNLYSL